jgi:hypothetical protein
MPYTETYSAIADQLSGAAWIPTALAATITGAGLKVLADAWRNHGPRANTVINQQKIVDMYTYGERASHEMEAAQRKWDNDLARAAAELQDTQDLLNDALGKQGQLTSTLASNLTDTVNSIKGYLAKLPAKDDVRRLLDALDTLANNIVAGATRIPPISEPATSDQLSMGRAATSDIFNAKWQSDWAIRNDPSRRYVTMMKGLADDVEMTDAPGDLPDHTPAPQKNQQGKYDAKWMPVGEPFKYDGSPEKWRFWYIKNEAYFGSSHTMWMNHVHVFNNLMSFTTPDSRAQKHFESLFIKIFNREGPLRQEFMALKGSYTIARWILDQVKNKFFTKVYQEKLEDQWDNLKQGSRSFESYWMYAEDLRLQLGKSIMDALAHQIKCADPDTMRELANFKNKRVHDLSFDDLDDDGEYADHQQKKHHRRKEASWRKDHQAPANHQTARSRGSTIETAQSAALTGTHEQWGHCNFPCWDHSPAVPEHLRGKHKTVKKHPDGTTSRVFRTDAMKNVCPQCRRPKNLHGGTQQGCRSPGNHSFHDKPAPLRQAEYTPTSSDDGSEKD